MVESELRKGKDFVKLALKVMLRSYGSVLERLGGAWEELRRGLGGGFGGLGTSWEGCWSQDADL